MTNEFYINGRLIDMPNDSVLALSFAVNTLFDVKTAQGNISNRVNLPKTRNNLIALGFLDDLGVDLSQTIRKKNKCRYVVGGVEIIRSGSVEIGDITSTAIGIVFTSGNLEFFDLIDGGSIRDLNLAEYDHVYNFDIPNSADNDEGYIYPVVNYGDLTNSSDFVNVLTMRPATFVRTIMNKIIEETGYTVDDRISTDALAGDQYARMIMPFSNDDFVHGQRAVDAVADAELQAEATSDYNHSFLHGNAPVTFDAFDTVIKDDTGAFSGQSIYTATKDFVAEISVTIPRADMMKIFIPFGQNKDLNSFDYNIVKTDGLGDHVLATNRATIPNYGADDTGPVYNYTQNALNVNASNVKIKTGDIIKFQILVDNDFDDGGATVHLYAPIDFNIKPSVGPIVFDTDVVQLEATLPDISKKDFLKGIANIFCTIIQTDNDNKIVSFVPFRQIPLATHKAKDWSDKLVNTTGYTRNVTIGDYAQQNTADYKDDDAITDLKPHYGQGIINIADENLDTIAKQLFELPFAASFEETVLLGVNAVDVHKIEIQTDIDFTISTKPRICMLQWHDRFLHFKSSDAPLYTYIRNEHNAFTYFKSNFTDGPGLMFDEILSRYFIEFSALLNDQRKTTEQLILTANDISELDFFIPVFIRKYAAYFYISKISNYVAGRPCKVDLIKLS